MLFPEEHAADLKKWIVKRLENTSDADADVLADYVLALLRHDGDPQAVRSLFESEMPDFLKEDSTVFVNDVFEAIAQKSYLPGAPQPRPNQQQHSALDPYSLSYDDIPATQGSRGSLPTSNESRKRTFSDRGEPATRNGRDGRFDGSSYKQARRGGPVFSGGGGGDGGGRSEDSENFQGATLPVPPFPSLPGEQQPPFPFPPIDPEIFRAFLEKGFPAGQNFAPFFPGQPARPPGRRRPRCRDYDTKGYCSRGSTCNFAHGDDSMYPLQFPMPFGQLQGVQSVEEYDPANALLPGIFNSTLVGQSSPNSAPGSRRSNPNHGRGGKRHGQSKRPQGKGLVADGPVSDKTKSTIVVVSIPEENFTQEQVREFFSQFGNILEVTLQNYKRTAIVRFDSWGAANSAYSSPKVIFDNRFVKVFWQKDDEISSSVNGANGFKKTTGGSVTGNSEPGAGGAGTPPPEIDMEEFIRKQEEAQKAYEEKARKLKEVEAQRLEVEKRQQELLAKQREARATLGKLLQKSRGNSADTEGETKSLKPTSTSEALRAQLAALEAEALQLGLDPDAPPTDEMTHSWSARGGGRGGGGYPYRARGYAPRGFRGGFRGGRGNNHAAYAMYSLDNRPKRVILTGVDFTMPEKDEMLRQYLFGVGEFTSIETSPTSTSISFKDRKTAEKFFNQVSLNGGEIPGINDGGKVELAWPDGSSSPVSSAAGTPSSTTGMNATIHGGGGHNTAATTKNGNVTATTTTTTTTTDDHNESSDDKDVDIILDSQNHRQAAMNQQQQQQSNDNDSMDYDVADDNQWD
ncbi:hypothetical protein QBC37DRAFT_327037 [Rhypophila decipiens]|uniref:Uncharacterized protein n=1 Tax=Rhypophila decipiens TaxID=261697 RepID=A0AAN6XVX8_9PEZI|nr:hypothetical protein QBC37DRAFT_327037 [Rhypophila decipiens]